MSRRLFLKSWNVPQRDLDSFVSYDSLCVKLTWIVVITVFMWQFENGMIIRCVQSIIHQLVKTNKTRLNFSIATEGVKEHSFAVAQSIANWEIESEEGGADKSIAKALIESLCILLRHLPAPWQTEARVQRPAQTTQQHPDLKSMSKWKQM